MARVVADGFANTSVHLASGLKKRPYVVLKNPGAVGFVEFVQRLAGKDGEVGVVGLSAFGLLIGARVRRRSAR